jgi:hypothetical protein
VQWREPWLVTVLIFPFTWTRLNHSALAKESLAMFLESRPGLTRKRTLASFFTEDAAPNSFALIMPHVLVAWICSVRTEKKSFVVLYISKNLIQTKEGGSLGSIYPGILIQTF